MVRRYPCPALSGLVLVFPNAASYACEIACPASVSAALAPRGSAQMKSPTSTKSAPAACEFGSLLARDGIADAGRFEHLNPPFEPLHDRPLVVACGPPSRPARRTANSPGTGFAGDHRVAPRTLARQGRQCAPASLTAPGILQRLDAAQMRAIGAGARHQFDMAVEQQRRTGVLDIGASVSPAKSWCAGRSASAAAAPPRLGRANSSVSGWRAARRHPGRREIEARRRARRTCLLPV